MNPTPQTSVPGPHPTSSPATPQPTGPTSPPSPPQSSAPSSPSGSAGPAGGDGSGFKVDGEALHADAAAVTEFAGRVSAVATGMPRAAPAPRWATTGATGLAADTARLLLSALGQDISDTGAQIRVVAADYEEADVRAATRLRATR